MVGEDGKGETRSTDKKKVEALIENHPNVQCVHMYWFGIHSGDTVKKIQACG
jgi:hypothetical protein